MKILIATTNKEKIREFKGIFSETGIEVESLLDYPEIEEIPEPYDTFAENAIVKAETVSKILNVMVIADDSGLCVDALNGFPGVHSARWSGEHRDYKQQNKKLLELMENEPNRKAHYNTTIALATNDETIVFEGIMPLTIAHDESLTEGFSYDTIVKYEDTFVSEMQPEDKNKYSSRAVAVQKVVEYIKNNTSELNGDAVEKGLSDLVDATKLAR